MRINDALSYSLLDYKVGGRLCMYLLCQLNIDRTLYPRIDVHFKDQFACWDHQKRARKQSLRGTKQDQRPDKSTYPIPSLISDLVISGKSVSSIFGFGVFIVPLFSFTNPNPAPGHRPVQLYSGLKLHEKKVGPRI